MGNNTTDNTKLDNTVKTTLNDYEAKYDAGDWSRMERMLDAAPKTSQTNWSYGIALLIGAVVIGGGYLAVKSFSSSPASTDTAVETTVIPENRTEQVIKTPPQPAAVSPDVPAANTTTPPAANNVIPEVKTTTPVSNTVAVPENNAMTPKTLAEKNKKNKKGAHEDTADYLKTQKMSVMGNEPVFGDMIDSSKGIIHETKEKESTKKAAKTKGNSTVGLTGLMNMHLNLDSIKKYNESVKPDSLKH